MPNLNKASFIDAAIDSVLRQSLEDIELVVVDDHSTDGSFEMAQRWARQDSRITLIRHLGTMGVSAARNSGIKAAKSDVIAFADSDDLYDPTKLERQLKALRELGSATVIYCDYWQIDERGSVLPPEKWPVYKKSGMIFGDVLEGRFGIKANILVPRKCFEEVGLFDEALPFSEDLDMVLRLSWAYPFNCVDEKLYSYRVFPGNTKNRLPQAAVYSTRALVIEKYYRRHKSKLTSEQRRSVILSLTKHYMRSSQTWRMIHYGLSSLESFRYMITEPLRGKGLRRLLRAMPATTSA